MSGAGNGTEPVPVDVPAVESAGQLWCDLCGQPAVRRGAGYVHGYAADAVFCALLFPRGRGVGSGGSE